MKQSSYKGKSPLPDFVIDAACAGFCSKFTVAIGAFSVMP